MKKQSDKQKALLPNSYVKRLPLTYAPSFYSMVLHQLEGLATSKYSDSITQLANAHQALDQSLCEDSCRDAKEVANSFRQGKQFWKGAYRLFRGFECSLNDAEAEMARKVLDLYNEVKKTPLRRTNLECQFLRMAHLIDDKWSEEEQQGTFLEPWKNQLVTFAAQYEEIYLRFVNRSNKHMTYTKFRNELNRCFWSLYLQLYVDVLTNPQSEVKMVYGKINHIVALFSTIFKVHTTKVYKSNHPEQQPVIPQNHSEQQPSDEETLAENLTVGQS